jgi:outer membrane protein OmpA-like peptidoglycan-associated protein
MRALLLILLLLPALALAQVTTDDSALKALQPPPGTKAAAAAPPAARVRHTVRRTTATRPAPLPQVPVGPPPNPVLLPPPQVLPVHAPVLPPAITPNPDAPTTATHLDGGVRLVFGPGSADLNQATLDAVQAVGAAAKADPLDEITITAWAPGVAEDPSSPHRLSLDRALAARAVLIHAGILAERIHAIAKGSNNIDGGPPDRMDVVAAHPRPTPPATQSSAPQKPAATRPGSTHS